MLALVVAVTACSRGADDRRVALPDQSGAKPAPVAEAAGSHAAGAADAVRASGSPAEDEGSSHVVWTGNTEPNRRSTIMPRIPGIIAKVHVREGDRVHKGDVLVTLDASDLELQEAEARAGVAQARVQVDTARIEFERAKKLFEGKAIPKRQLDLARAQFKGARAGLKRAQAALARAKKAVDDAVIRAPFDGVVILRHKNEGEYAAAMPPTPLVTIDELDPLRVKVDVPSKDLAWVRRGTAVRVELDALGRSVDAHVERIVPALNPVTRTATVIVEVPNADYSLPSGMFARVRPIVPPHSTARAHVDEERGEAAGMPEPATSPGPPAAAAAESASSSTSSPTVRDEGAGP